MSVVSCSELVIFGGVCWSGEELKRKSSFWVRGEVSPDNKAR